MERHTTTHDDTQRHAQGYPDYPDGALRTTAPLLARHLGMVMRGGTWCGRRILSRASVRELRRDQIPSLEPEGLLWYRWRAPGAS